MIKVAIVTGVSGQDGSYLSKILLNNGYKVIGLVRDKHLFDHYKLDYLSIRGQVIIEEVNLLNYEEILGLIKKYNPSKIFNFASQSSVGLSHSKPRETLEFNIQSVVNLLECIRVHNKHIRFFHASSSEIFGDADLLPVNEETPINPNNMYAVSKVACHHIISNYRSLYGLYLSSAIFFNHESVLRGENFVIKKIIRDLVKVKNKRLARLVVGNIDIKRDFGYAPEYMEAVYSMLQLEHGEDFIISSGKSLSISDIIIYVLNKLHLNSAVLEINRSLFRTNDIKDIY
jgi:GDPmannose 4,6-dehydratase